MCSAMLHIINRITIIKTSTWIKKNKNTFKGVFFYLASRSPSNLFCFSNFKFKSIIIWAFSPFRLCNSVSCSCCVSSLLSSCDIFAVAAALVPFDGAALPDLSCSFSTDNFKFNVFNSYVVSSKRLSKNQNKHKQQNLIQNNYIRNSLIEYTNYGSFQKFNNIVDS